jgi:CubicO group peptidase (beta-lactamase class C family)
MLLRFLCSLLISASLSASAQTKDTLPSATPESRGFSAGTFRRLPPVANGLIPSLRSFLVWRGDALVYEGYFHGAGPDSAYSVKSVTKSVLSAIAGAAYARGLLPDLDRPVVEVLPEYGGPERYEWPDEDSLRRTVSLRHLLTMTTGQMWDEGDSMTLMPLFAASSDPVRFALDLPFDDDPGTTFNYSSAAADVFAVALARLVGSDLRAFADSALFRPAHIGLRRWESDPMGRYGGGSGMFFTPRELIRFGVLYLKKGRVDDREVLPESWITESTRRQIGIRHRWTIPGVEGYGYYWWLRRGAGRRMFCAMGYGGQLVCVVPDLDMVMAVTCGLGGENRGRGELPRVYRLVDRVVRGAGR